MKFDILDKIAISGDDKTCTFCGRSYPHRRVHVGDDDDVRKGMKHHEEIITAHGTCRFLSKQKRELEQKLLELNWKIFQHINRP